MVSPPQEEYRLPVPEAAAFEAGPQEASMRIAICLFHRDENSYLPEWLDHHRALGVERFYLYDNGSRESPPACRDVTVVDFSHDQQLGKQMRAYHHCHETHRRAHDWIGFLDTDEFVVGDLRRLLGRVRSGWLSRVRQVCLSTRLYGSNGLDSRPARQFGSYGSYWMPNQHVKSFVHCGKPMVAVPMDPHAFPCGGATVNAAGARHDGPIGPHVDGPVVVDHYYTRSRAEWEEKCGRGRGDGAGHRTLAEFDMINEHVTAHCRSREAGRFAA